mgnify:FL=1
MTRQVKTRDLQIVEMSKLGYTLAEIARALSLSRERVRQIVNAVDPTLTREFRGVAIHTKLKNDADTIRQMVTAQKKWGFIPRGQRTELEQRQFEFFLRKRQNVKSTKHFWNITMEDITFPTHCPMLGIELNWYATARSENSPSLDRLDNTKGYIPGNVAVISYRANRIKNDGTWQEHEKIFTYLKKYLG